jgi:hypothetical protein
MDTNLAEREQRDDSSSMRVGAPIEIPLHQRLALSALVTGVNLWIRVVELTPESRRNRMT